MTNVTQDNFPIQFPDPTCAKLPKEMEEALNHLAVQMLKGADQLLFDYVEPNTLSLLSCGMERVLSLVKNNLAKKRHQNSKVLSIPTPAIAASIKRIETGE